jgi:hypothetical protein
MARAGDPSSHGLPVTGSIASGALLGTLYAIACVGTGAALAAILRRLMPSDESMPLRIATRFALGHLVLGSLWTLAALGGRFDVALVAVVVALGVASAVWLAVWSVRGGAAKEERDPGAPGWSRTALLFCALGAALVLLRSLAPPLNDDALRGYLVTARVVAETHELAFQPFNPFVIWPLLAEMNGAATLLLGNETAATIFDTWVALALLTAVAALSARAGLPPRGAWVAVLCLVSSSAFLGLVGAFKVDIVGALYGILAAVFCLQGRAAFPVPWLAGLFFGSSVAVKVSNLFLLPGLALLLWPREAALPRRALAAFGLAGGLALTPQLLKNLSLVANPVAPFLGSWFGTADSYWTASLGGDIGGPADLTWVHRFLWPVILTYGGHTGMLGTVSPLLLGLLPFAFRLGLPEVGAEAPGACGSRDSGGLVPRVSLGSHLSEVPVHARSPPECGRRSDRRAHVGGRALSLRCPCRDWTLPRHGRFRPSVHRLFPSVRGRRSLPGRDLRATGERAPLVRGRGVVEP